MQDKILQLQRTIIHTTATRPRLALFPGPLWTRQFSDEVLSSDNDIVYTLHDYNIVDQTLQEFYKSFSCKFLPDSSFCFLVFWTSVPVLGVYWWSWSVSRFCLKIQYMYKLITCNMQQDMGKQRWGSADLDLYLEPSNDLEFHA